MTSLFTFHFNPSIALPWVTPTFVTAFMQGGVPYLLLIIACIAVTTLIWFPFFRMADNQAYLEEQEGNKAND